MLSVIKRMKGRYLSGILVLLLILLQTSGCTIKIELGRRSAEESVGVERGLASWYGPGFYGKRTASGEIYTGRELTAAHRSLPFGTKVRVTRLDDTGRSVVVRINDRGPLREDRIIDLSERAAKEIGLKGEGFTEVMIETIK